MKEFRSFVFILMMSLLTSVKPNLAYAAQCSSLFNSSDIQISASEAQVNSTFQNYVKTFVREATAPTPGLFPIINERMTRLFARQNLMLSMGQKEDLRSIIVQSPQTFRFKNMHETKTSSAKAPSFARQINERLRLGLTEEEYNRILVEDLPKSGFLQFRSVPDGVGGGLQRLTLYGDDIWGFKTDHVLSSTTLTPLDSFEVYGVKATLNKAVEYFGVDPSMANPIAHFIPLTWNKLIPWMTETLFSSEATLTAFSYHRNQNQEMGSEALQEVLWKKFSSREEVAPPIFGNFLARLTYDGTGSTNILPENYIELQYFKSDLNLGDVESFTFTKTPPTSELERILRERNIMIFDWRDKFRPPEPFPPPQE